MTARVKSHSEFNTMSEHLPDRDKHAQVIASERNYICFVYSYPIGENHVKFAATAESDDPFSFD